MYSKISKIIQFKQLLVIFIIIFSGSSFSSERVKLEVKSGIFAEADYFFVPNGKPVIIVLHGFLQTNNYLTLSNITDGVIDNDFSILVPTQSLGINLRKTSLPCQSTHTHLMKDSFTEIDKWMSWLKKKGHHNAILIGHSFGSVTAIAYLENYKKTKDHPNIQKVVGLSLIDTEFVPDRKRREQDRLTARKRIKEGDDAVHTYRLSYCHLYRAPAKAFLSYADWTSERILTALDKVSKKINVVSILGSKDKRVPDSWPKKQRKSGATVKIVNGANHFFGGSQQFDLIDLLEEILNN